MASIAQLESALVKADAAGNAADAKMIADEIRRLRSASPEPQAEGPVTPLPQKEPEPFFTHGNDGLTPNQMVDVSRKMGVITARAAPVVASIVAPPVGIAGWLGLAAVGGGSEMAAQALEGNNPFLQKNLAQAGKAAVLTGMPTSKVAPGGWLKAGWEATKTGLVAGATEATAETVSRSIEQGRLASYENIKDGLRGTSAPAVATFALSGISSKLSGSLGAARETIDANRQRNIDIGITPENTTLATLVPGTAHWEQNVARRGAAGVREQVLGQQSDITRHFASLVDKAATNPELAKQLNPIIEVVQAAERKLVHAEEASKGAVLNFQKLSAAADQAQAPNAALSAAFAQASQDVLMTVSAKAAARWERNNALGQFVTNSQKAAELTKTVEELFEARKAISKALYTDTGIPMGAPLFAKQDLITAAKAGMGGVDEVDAHKIIEVIKGYGVDATSTHLSLGDFQGLRAKISNAFADKIDPKALDRAEALANRAYGAMGEAGKGTIKVNFGDEVLVKYEAAQKFWRETSEASKSALGRSLLQRGDIIDSTITQMASGIANGNVDELNQFKTFIGYINDLSSVNKNNPAVAKQAVQVMEGALRNAFILKHSTTGKLNHDALLTELMGGVRLEKDLPFPIERLGFGNRDTISQMRGVVREFKKEGLTESVMNDMLASAEVRQAIEVGGADAGKVIRREIAQRVYKDKAYTRAALEYAGMKGKAEDAGKVAERLKIDEGYAKKVMEDIQNDPVLSAFTGKGKWKLTDELGATDDRSVTGFITKMDPAKAKVLMDGLRAKDEQLAKLVEDRVLTDKLSVLFKTETEAPGASQRLKLHEVRAFFNPIHDRGSQPIALLEGALDGPTLRRVKSVAEKLATIQDEFLRGNFPGTKEMQALVDAAGIRAVVKGEGRSWLYAFSRLRDALSTGAYSVLSKALVDPDHASALFDPSMTIAEALGSLPAQKAYLLANDAVFMNDVKKLEGLPNWQGSKVIKNAVPLPPPQQPPAAPVEQAPAPPPAAPPQKTVQFQEGRLYLDPETGVKKRYRNGAFV
jgi:hypothetical protein